MAPLLKNKRKLWKQRFDPLTYLACIRFRFVRLRFQSLKDNFPSISVGNYDKRMTISLRMSVLATESTRQQ